MRFYIGTYTSGSSRGIHCGQFDPDTGRIRQVALAAEVDNPSFLTIHPNGKIVYSCREIRRDGKREGSQVRAFEIEENGGLKPIGDQPSGGKGPCYITTDRTGRVLLVANYASGSIAAFPIANDGTIGEMSSHAQHVGQSVNPTRQEGPHAHCITTDPSNRYVCAVDLGLDRIVLYALDSQGGRLTARPECDFPDRPGSGPRHLTFHPNGKLAFLIYEMGNTLSALRWDASAGRFTELDYVSTLPEGFSGENTTAEILVHPSGKFVYGSNRGHDSVVAYALDEASGTLTWIGHTPSGGKTPRNFCIDPTGRYLLSENQDSDSIVVFSIDPDTGKLTSVGESTSVGSPCCIKFVTDSQAPSQSDA